MQFIPVLDFRLAVFFFFFLASREKVTPTQHHCRVACGILVPRGERVLFGKRWQIIHFYRGQFFTTKFMHSRLVRHVQLLTGRLPPGGIGVATMSDDDDLIGKCVDQGGNYVLNDLSQYIRKHEESGAI